MEFHVNPWNPVEFHGFPWTIDFHGILWIPMVHELPWNSLPPDSMETHGIPCMEFHGMPWNSIAPWDSMGSSMEFHRFPWSMNFHGILRISIGFHGDTWNSVESH